MQKPLLLFFLTLDINVPEGGLKKIRENEKAGYVYKIPCGHKRASFHV